MVCRRRSNHGFKLETAIGQPDGCWIRSESETWGLHVLSQPVSGSVIIWVAAAPPRRHWWRWQREHEPWPGIGRLVHDPSWTDTPVPVAGGGTLARGAGRVPTPLRATTARTALPRAPPARTSTSLVAWRGGLSAPRRGAVPRPRRRSAARVTAQSPVPEMDRSLYLVVHEVLRCRRRHDGI
jgi:hypothetical protein